MPMMAPSISVRSKERRRTSYGRGLEYPGRGVRVSYGRGVRGLFDRWRKGGRRTGRVKEYPTSEGRGGGLRVPDHWGGGGRDNEREREERGGKI